MKYSRPQVLIVEDDAAMRVLLQSALSKNYTTASVVDGLSAMHWLSQGNIPSLVITDINMPHLDGLSLMKNLKISGLYRDIPVIVLSGGYSENDKKNSLENGAFAYMMKPFDMNKLIELTEKAISHTKKIT